VTRTLLRSLPLAAALVCLVVGAVAAVPINPGDILVADRDAFGGPEAVIHVDPVTGVQTMITCGGLFISLWGIALDTNDDILIADPSAFGGLGGVIQIDPSTGAQLPISVANAFVNPNGITTGGGRPVPAVNTTLGRIKVQYRQSDPMSLRGGARLPGGGGPRRLAGRGRADPGGDVWPPGRGLIYWRADHRNPAAGPAAAATR
jgi:hypothetical protein